MGAPLEPIEIKYDLNDVFNALTDIVQERMSAVAGIPESYGANQLASSLLSAQEALTQVKTWKQEGVTQLVTKFAVPSKPNPIGIAGADLVSQILCLERLKAVQEEGLKKGFKVDPSSLPTMTPYVKRVSFGRR
jgi:hypothetical protein